MKLTSSGLFSLCFLLASFSVSAQGNFFGGLQLDNDFFIRDEQVNAVNTPHYDNLKSATNAWVDLNYVNEKFGLDAGVRFDFFFNSNLHVPGTPYSAQGVGRYYIRKRFKSLTITAGHFYDQIGSGIIFRSYEDRSLGIDNALLGAHAEYDVKDFLTVKAFVGVQKNRLKLYKPVIKGAALDGNFSLGEKVQLLPGFGVVNRTIDQASMDFIVSAIESYDSTDRFVPKYNTYAFSVYNTLNVGKFSWYVEGAYKTNEAITQAEGQLADKAGTVLFTSLTYSTKGFGISGQYKRTENFVFRTSPNESLLNGMISYIPPVSRQNSLRLPARYIAATQEWEEQAYSLDVTYSPKRGVTLNLNGSEVRKLNGNLVWRELYADVEWRINRKWRMEAGLQYMLYDQVFYQGEAYTADNRDIQAYTPFVELIYKINRKHALRLEVQYQNMDEDFGSWMYALVEYSFSPYFTLAVSDMWNFDPNPVRADDDLHYYTVYGAFTYEAHRVTLGYVRQVEGVVCTGGICRFEPAFSGVRLGLSTTF